MLACSALLAGALVGCTGSITTGDSDPPGGNTGDPGQLADGVPFSTRVARLTHAQYDNTTSDLLFLDVRASSEFEGDPVFNGYDNSIEDLKVAGRLGRDYRRAAEQLAQRAVSDPASYEKLRPSCESADAACGATFVRDFGRRAFRRPTTTAEQAAYSGLFTRGAELLASGDAIKDGVQLVIEAMLQSPKFLYRAELTRDQQADGFLKLDGYEIAQRLSYLFWNTMPDQALLDAAERARLNDVAGIAAEIARMVQDVRAERPIADFHHQYLQLDGYLDLTRSAELFPNFSSDLGPDMQEETRQFVRHVVFDLGRGYQTLMTAPFTFASERLAKLYGVPITGSGFQKIQLEGSPRRGLLSQIGFLASHAYPGETSPIHRGVFVYRRILCKTVPEPVGIDTSQGKVEDPRTTREAIEIQTGQTGCKNCHAQFNPLGFAFEHFDAVGQLRTSDRGNPVNTAGETQVIDGLAVQFDSSAELLEALARSEDARRCYAENLLKFAYGREDAPSDEQTLAKVAAAMASDGYSALDMLTDLAQAKAFRFRAPNAD